MVNICSLCVFSLLYSQLHESSACLGHSSVLFTSKTGTRGFYYLLQEAQGWCMAKLEPAYHSDFQTLPGSPECFPDDVEGWGCCPLEGHQE